MTHIRRSRLGALSAELGIVVLGVLIALAANSWWESRQDDVRVGAYLVALRHDLDDAAESLGAAITATESQLEATEQFLELLVSTNPIPDSSRASPVLRTTPKVPTGALDALWETGDINLLDESIRTEIASHRATFESLSTQLVEFRVAGHVLAGEMIEAVEDLRVPGQSAYGTPDAPSMRGRPRVIALYRRHRESLRNELNLFRGLAESVAGLSADLDAN